MYLFAYHGHLRMISRLNIFNYWFIMKRILALSTCSLGMLNAEDTAKLYQMNCLACHKVENKKPPFVGPSLVEINHLYKNDLEGFIKWCKVPGKKRKNAINMPSMAHLGDEKLSEIHAYIKKITAGKKWVPKEEVQEDKYKLSGAAVTQPRVQRMFMPNASPAAIAVTLDGKHSLCWDTLSCRLRYIWHGGFSDASPHWQSKGNTLAPPVGEIYFTSKNKGASGFLLGSDPKPKFEDYEMKNKLPEFRYRLGQMLIKEGYSNDNGAVRIDFTITNPPSELSYVLGDLEKAKLTHSKGKLEQGGLKLTAEEARSFSLTFEPKK